MAWFGLACVATAGLWFGVDSRPATAQDLNAGEKSGSELRVGLSGRTGLLYDHRIGNGEAEYVEHGPWYPLVGVELFGGIPCGRTGALVGVAVRDYWAFLLHVSAFIVVQPTTENGLFFRFGAGPATTLFLRRSRLMNPGYYAGAGWFLSGSSRRPGWYVELSLERFDLEVESNEEGHADRESEALSAALMVMGYQW
jgi:hypothetical protein